MEQDPESQIISRKRQASDFPSSDNKKISKKNNRVGHISVNCRGKARCLYCGSDRHNNTAECPNKDKTLCCINCKGSHTAIAQSCPAIIQQKMIAALAAEESIPLAEARKRLLHNLSPHINTAHNNAYLDPRFDYKNFPYINYPSPQARASLSRTHSRYPNNNNSINYSNTDYVYTAR